MRNKSGHPSNKINMLRTASTIENKCLQFVSLNSSLDVPLFSVQCYHKVIFLDGLLDSLREFEVLSIRQMFTSTPTLKLYKNVNFAR